ncbi:Helitron helicase-like protein [Phytophthora palmivora]|uniref:Helitron helicase-like protein n=1 Tax=Phytophthora palmivora TaxID=4796 RepID=A0A2P4Y780_9STRA|nr:Helitron helicase-like protein [Phytophthora palmivora]
MNASEVEELRESNRVSHNNLRDGLSNEQQQLQKIQDAEAHRDRREGTSTEESQVMRDEDAVARRATRENMTEEENNRRREAERFRRRSRKYQKGLAYYEAFDPSTIPGSCCRKGLVTVRPPREAPTLFGNPRFKQSIRAYNNVFAFTSMGPHVPALSTSTKGGLFVIVWEHYYRPSTDDQCLRKYTLMIRIWKHA